MDRMTYRVDFLTPLEGRGSRPALTHFHAFLTVLSEFGLKKSSRVGTHRRGLSILR